MIATTVAVLAACSAQPTARAPASAPVAAAVPAAAAAAIRATDEKYATFVRWARAEGYRPVQKNGRELFWCREGSALGSRLVRQACIGDPKDADVALHADDVPGQGGQGE